MLMAAIGFRVHSGWAMAVAVSGSKRRPEVLARLRLEMVDGQSPGGKQPYHRAAELKFSDAENLVSSATTAANKMAAKALRNFISQLSEQEVRIVSAGVLAGSGRPLGDLQSVLASHPTIHTAEGELFRNALLHACGACTLPANRIREKELVARAVGDLRLDQQQITARLQQMSQKVGRPWTQDEKFAALTAWLLLPS
jgi:hypothetical protein